MAEGFIERSREHKRVPVVFITGYLGAGKTTLLNHILGFPGLSSLRLSLIINDFASRGIDGALVRPGSFGIHELNQGSIFCSCTQADLLKTFARIATEPRPDLVLIEATGISETRDFETLLGSRHFRDVFTVSANICVVDALTFVELLPVLRAVRSQVEWADLIVMTKGDLAGASASENTLELLEALNPRAPRVTAPFGRLDWDAFQSIRHMPVHGRSQELLTRVQEDVFSLFVVGDPPLDREAFYGMVEGLLPSILRLKGYVDFGDGPRFIEVASRTIQEKEPGPRSKKANSLSVIAWRLPKIEIEKRFAALGLKEEAAGAGEA